MKPYPLNAVDLGKLRAKLRKRTLAVEIGAVFRDILSDNNKLLDAVLGKRTGFLKYVRHTA